MNFDEFSILGHRGCSSLAPENTRASFQAAHQYGATGVELDVSLLGDNSLVVFHDETVDRCTNSKGKLTDFTLDQIKQLDHGSWFSAKFKNERVLTLEEVLALLQTLTLDLNLEMKPYKGGEHILVEAMHDILKKCTYFTTKNLLLSSFDYDTLVLTREAFPDAKIAILYEKSLPVDWMEQVLRIHACAININEKYASESIISEIIQAGLKVYVWTVNDFKRGKQLIDMGVNGIITDRPQDFLLEQRAG